METPPPNTPQRRAYFRLKFPDGNEPILYIEGLPYRVVDLSEQGIRVHNPLNRRFPEDIFISFLHFRERTPIKLVGRTIRADKDTTAIQLVIGVPYQVILEQQKRLLKLRNM